MDEPLFDLNPSIRAEMARRGETQITLAPKLGMSQSALSRRLTDDATWTVAEIVRLCDVLDVPLSALLVMRASA